MDKALYTLSWPSSPPGYGASEIQAFLFHLAVQRNVAAATQNQALCALVFLDRKVLNIEFGQLDEMVRVRCPKRIPEAFTREEARAVIAS